MANVACPHRALYDSISATTVAIHHEHPGRHHALPSLLHTVVDLLDRQIVCLTTCRASDPLARIVNRLLRDIYQEITPTAIRRDVSRNLRRAHHDLRPYLGSLLGDHRALLTRPSPSHGITLTDGSRLVRALAGHGERVELIPASVGLSTFVAYRRDLHPYLWDQYVLSTHDRSLLAVEGPTPLLGRFRERSTSWLSADPTQHCMILDALGWTTTLNAGQRHTLSVLAVDWHGSIAELLDASIRLG